MRTSRCSRLLLFFCFTALAGCAGGVAVTPESIREARARWDRANVRSYDLEWSSAGPRNAQYVVAVRDGRVKTIESITTDGRRVVVKPVDTRFYSVDGLFMTIDEELAQLDQPSPFGQPKGTKSVLRFTPDPTYGYPKSYRRDVMGSPVALTIDVNRFTPATTEAK
jgi:hypothetical protein